MTRKITQKHVWNKTRIRHHGVYVEIDECKPLGTACAIIFPLLTIIGFAMLPTFSINPSPILSAVGVMVGGLAAFASLIVAAVYRPPRVLQMYPVDGLARVCRRFLCFDFSNRWYDLNDASFKLELRYVRGEKIESSGQIALGCLSVFFGPLALISLLMGSKEYEQLPVYCLMHPSEASTPVAIFLLRSDASNILELTRRIERIE